MILDAFQPEGVTMLAVDSIFMMPHLGVLSEVHESAATEVFDRDCLIRLGSSISPVGLDKDGKKCIDLTLIKEDGSKIEKEINFGELLRIPLSVGEKAKAIIEPSKNFDVGAGKGKKLEADVEGGVVGIVVDCRGRPLTIPTDPKERVEKLSSWIRSLDVYPIELYEKLLK